MPVWPPGGYVVTLAGQKLTIARPRPLQTDGAGVVPAQEGSLLQSREAMPQAVLRRMENEVRTREYEREVDVARDDFRPLDRALPLGPADPQDPASDA